MSRKRPTAVFDNHRGRPNHGQGVITPWLIECLPDFGIGIPYESTGRHGRHARGLNGSQISQHCDHRHEDDDTGHKRRRRHNPRTFAHH
jgi:hypothetical protein